MGFDIYGLNPTQLTSKPEILNKDWGDLNEQETEIYFDARRKYEQANPGEYFRNNVWWWRPLWDYVCVVCDEVLSDKDKDGGCHNSGHKISEKKTNEMCELLKIEILLDKHKEYEEIYKERINNLPLEQCSVCEGTGQREQNMKRRECTSCNGLGKRKSWDSNYPFSAENVERFVDFLSYCNGMQIC